MYRVIPGFICQWGVPASPAEWQKWGANKIKDDPVKVSNTPGTLSFATSGPDARGSQLFINYCQNESLDGQGFSPFATVTSGMDVVRAIEALDGTPPKKTIEIVDAGELPMGEPVNEVIEDTL